MNKVLDFKHQLFHNEFQSILHCDNYYGHDNLKTRIQFTISSKKLELILYINQLELYGCMDTLFNYYEITVYIYYFLPSEIFNRSDPRIDRNRAPIANFEELKKVRTVYARVSTCKMGHICVRACRIGRGAIDIIPSIDASVQV